MPGRLRIALQAAAVSVVALLLALNRKIPRASNRVRDLNFSLNGLLGFDLHGKTAGIIGTGKIGRATAQILSGFGMTVLACKRNPSERTDRGYGLPGTGDREGRLPAGWFGPAELPRMLPRCDVVVLCAPLTAETRRLIDRAAISAMKPTAYVINTARGPVVDQRTLHRALVDGTIAGAGLDVFEVEPCPADEPILQLDNVIVTPHALCWTDECFAGNGAADVRAVLEVMHGRTPVGIVNKDVVNQAAWRGKLEGLRARFGG